MKENDIFKLFKYIQLTLNIGMGNLMLVEGKYRKYENLAGKREHNKEKKPNANYASINNMILFTFNS